MMKVNRRPILIASAAILLFMVALAAWAAAQIPAGAHVPLHWDAAGHVNRYGDRSEAIRTLFMLPAIALVITAVLAVIPSIEPRRSNLLKSWRAYVAVWLGVLLLEAAVQVVIVASTLAPATAGRIGGSVVIAAAGTVIAVVGNYLPKIRSNFMFGIRTPWTLTSELSWNRTHRLGGRLLVAVGLLMVAAAAFLGQRLILGFGLAVLVLAAVATLFIYSYLVWRQDPGHATG